MPLAIFGITNDGLSLFVNLLVLFLAVVWLALVAWTYLDAKRRIDDPVLIACATGASLFPFVGTVVYSILRPPEYLEDARERELEIRAAELRVRQLEEQSCPSCEYPVERTYLRCPNCRARVKDPCAACGKPIDPRWSVCPYCETPVPRAVPQRPQRESRPPASGARKPAQRKARPAGSQRAAGARVARVAETQRAADSKRGPSRPAPRREGPGEDRPRPATAP